MLRQAPPADPFSVIAPAPVAAAEWAEVSLVLEEVEEAGMGPEQKASRALPQISQAAEPVAAVDQAAP